MPHSRGTLPFRAGHRRTQPWCSTFTFISSELCLQYMLLWARSNLCSMMVPSSRSSSDWESSWHYRGSLHRREQKPTFQVKENPFTLSSNATSNMLLVRDGGILWTDRQKVAQHYSSILPNPNVSKLSFQSHLSCNYSYPACIIAQNHNISSSIDRGMINNLVICWDFWWNPHVKINFSNPIYQLSENVYF